MKIYQNEYFGPGGQSHGYSYHLSKRAALKEAAERAEKTKDNLEPVLYVTTEEISIQRTREGIVHALNRFGSHPDNG